MRIARQGQGGQARTLVSQDGNSWRTSSWNLAGADYPALAKHAAAAFRDGSPVAAPSGLLAPVASPQKVLCIGLNYLDHCREQNVEPPKAPLVFTKLPSSVVGHGDAIEWDPEYTQKVDYEAELAFVIGAKARHVTAAKAMDHVAGYLCANDVTARDFQKGDGQWTRGKSLDTFCPLGPFLVTADAIPDPHALRIRCRVNGELRQDSTTANLIFKVPELVAYLSQAFTLYPGDVVLTGTPPGVGVFRKPSVYLGDGDQVSVDIEGLGQLENRCVAPGRRPQGFPTLPKPS